MLSLPYIDRDYNSVFEDIKNIIQTIEPRANVDLDKANVESIITKIIAGCFDSLSYNQDANIFEAFPSTSRDARAVFDLLSIVGYTPKTAKCCRLTMTLWNPSFTGTVVYNPYCSISVDNKTFYNPESFQCTENIATVVEWYQGTLIKPDRRSQLIESSSFIQNYYPNLSINVLENNQYKLPENHTRIDSRTIKVFLDDGTELTYVDNPYKTNTTKSSFSLLPSVNNDGYSLVFSKDVSSGSFGDNLYYFYVISDGYDVGNNLIPNFSGLSVDGVTIPSFSYSYSAEASHDIETASEARENVALEFGWRDTPNAIVTVYDAERAILQNSYVAAVSIKDGNNYSKCDSKNFEIEAFIKVNEETEQLLNVAVADGLKNRLQTYFNKFKMLPLSFKFHIDDIETEQDENLTVLYYWYPKVTLYLKEQVNSQDAAAIINSVEEALFAKFSPNNTNYNQVPRIVDVIETIKNASSTILYLDIDGIDYIDKSDNIVDKEVITCTFTYSVPKQTGTEYTLQLNTLNNTRNIEYHSIKIVNNNNEIIAYDNGGNTGDKNTGVILPYGPYLDGQGTINYNTGELKFKLSAPLADTANLQILYKQETPTFCEYINKAESISIALESLKA